MAGCAGYIYPHQAVHARHPTENELYAFYGTVYQMAPYVRAWSGRAITDAEVMAFEWTLTQNERNQHDDDENCRGGSDDNKRAAGFQGFTSECAARYLDRLGLWQKFRPEDLESCDPCRQGFCDWWVDHPEAQAKVGCAALARNLRDLHGNVRAVWSQHRWGRSDRRTIEPIPTLISIWKRRWPAVPFRPVIPKR